MNGFKILSITPEYDKYGHVTGFKIKCKNDWIEELEFKIVVGIASKKEGEFVEKKGRI